MARSLQKPELGKEKPQPLEIEGEKRVLMIINSTLKLGTDKVNGVNGVNGVHPKEASDFQDGRTSEMLCKPRTPDHQPVKNVPPEQVPVYIDLDECNVGFKHWHPTPLTQNGDKLCGQGELGGIWEWTSSPLEPHEGFSPMELYPGYTCTYLFLSHTEDFSVLTVTTCEQRISLMGNTT